ncbi:helix-turn-helix domain-containing protein [Paenibacillus terrigena]|uniref:helix-turn-helix domain-containing protein n=1 Tax=Paenibacillus terrigena TaxID=369333 RepID=UPI000367149C|nr:helix-turn-helix domain-containing protein [Paenibacillus terrigena]
MKQLNISAIISSFILGLSIVISGVIISNSGDRELNKDGTSQKEYKPLMTIKETAEYLNITELQVRTIISSEETMLKTTGTYSSKMFPIFRIGTDIYISTDELKEWLKESTTLRIQY